MAQFYQQRTTVCSFKRSKIRKEQLTEVAGKGLRKIFVEFGSVGFLEAGAEAKVTQLQVALCGEREGEKGNN